MIDVLEVDKNVIKEEDISGMSLKEFREVFIIRCLFVIGKKSELVEWFIEVVKVKDVLVNKGERFLLNSCCFLELEFMCFMMGI